MGHAKKNILVVDDSAISLSSLSFLLNTNKYGVTKAESGMEALNILGQSPRNHFDLLLTDFVMPKMDGNELIRKAKLIDPNLRCLMVSGKVQVYPAGILADVFLTKAVNTPHQLIEQVRILTTRKRGPKKTLILLDREVEPTDGYS